VSFVSSAAVFVSFVLVVSYGLDTNVVEMHDKNFDSLLSSSSKWLIEVYAPWCGFCKDFAPVYEEIATKLKGKVNVGKIDGTSNPELQLRLQVKGYPSIYFVENEQMTFYDGERTLEDVTKFALGGYAQLKSEPLADQNEKTDEEEEQKPQSKVLRVNSTGLELVRAKHPFWLVSFSTLWCRYCDAFERTVLEEIATAYVGRSLAIAKMDITHDKKTMHQLRITYLPALRLFVGEKVYEYVGDYSVKDLGEYLEKDYRDTEPIQLTTVEQLYLEYFDVLSPIKDYVSTHLLGTIVLTALLFLILGFLVGATSSKLQTRTAAVTHETTESKSREKTKKNVKKEQ